MKASCVTSMGSVQYDVIDSMLVSWLSFCWIPELWFLVWKSFGPEILQIGLQNTFILKSSSLKLKVNKSEDRSVKILRLKKRFQQQKKVFFSKFPVPMTLD